MNVAELKLELFRKIDSLDSSTIQEAYGILFNYINSKNDYKEWDDLTENQKNALLYGLKELNDGSGIVHEDVIKKYRNKYPNA